MSSSSSSSDHHSISGGEPAEAAESIEAAGAACPNCGDDRPGTYCARCGQSDRDYMRSAWLVACDYLRDTFEVDSRVFRTLKLLFFKPGRLSSEFSRNRRARYMSPVKLFLFLSFVHFGVLALVLRANPSSGDGGSSSSTPMWPFEEGFPAGEFEDSPFGREPAPDQVEAVRARLEPEQRARLDDILGRGPDDPGRLVLASLIATETGEASRAEALAYRLVIKLTEDPDALFDPRSSGASIVMLLSLPLYALLLAVAYFDKRRFFVEHLVLVVHMQCFSMAVLTIPMVAPNGILRMLLLAGASIGSMAYYLAALRGYFQEGWGKTFARWVIFAILSACVSLAVGLALLFLT